MSFVVRNVGTDLSYAWKGQICIPLRRRKCSFVGEELRTKVTEKQLLHLVPPADNKNTTSWFGTELPICIIGLLGSVFYWILAPIVFFLQCHLKVNICGCNWNILTVIWWITMPFGLFMFPLGWILTTLAILWHFVLWHNLCWSTAC